MVKAMREGLRLLFICKEKQHRQSLTKLLGSTGQASWAALRKSTQRDAQYSLCCVRGQQAQGSDRNCHSLSQYRHVCSSCVHAP